MHPAVALALASALVGGALAALQTPTNAMVARAVNSPLNAALVSFAVGTAALAVIAFAVGERPNLAGVRALPWYAWLGGLYGAFFVTAAAFAAPRIGVAVFVAVLVAGQLLMALLLDHLGAYGLERQPITAARVGGVLLILSGVLLVRR
jgi:transporter family-2 protein